MPLMKCSTCASLFHVRPAEPIAWKTQHPGPEPIPGVCFLCWGSLAPGQRVRVRWLSEQSQARLAGVGVGAVGTISRVLRATPEGVDDAYSVAFSSREGAPALEAPLLRRELHRVMGEAEDAAR